MPCELLQIHNLAKRALRIRRVPKGVEAFLQRNNSTCALIHSFPYNAVRLRQNKVKVDVSAVVRVDMRHIRSRESHTAQLHKRRVTHPFAELGRDVILCSAREVTASHCV